MGRPRLTLPHEHGAWLTLAGATVAGIALASDRWTAGGFALALVAAFFARAPLERARPAAWDGTARIVYGVALVTGALVAGQSQQWLGAGAALFAGAVLALSWWARRARRERTPTFEALAMAALGASSGLMAWAGRAPFAGALALSLVLGTHAAVSVPLVRSDLRRRERQAHGRAAALAATTLFLAALVVWGLGSPVAALGLAPRALELLVRPWTRAKLTRPALVGARESLELAAAITLLLLLR